MEIKGEAKRVNISRKIEDDGREVTILDLRIRVVDGVNAQKLIELAGINVIVDVEKAQLSLEG